jgi:YesN/AraC family two-component response regulator
LWLGLERAYDAGTPFGERLSVGHSILVVDDEEDVRRALVRVLRREGYEIVAASSGPEALALLQRSSIDIIVTDQMMPEMTGLEFLVEAKRVQPSAIRIILTGYADFEVVKAAINDAEIYRFLTKPWDDDDLRLTLRQAAHRIQLERDNARLENTVREHETRLRELERAHPGITHVKRDETGAIVLDDIGADAAVGTEPERS